MRLRNLLPPLAALLAMPLLSAPAGGQSAADRDLERRMARLLPRVEKISGLRAKEPIRVALRDRDELRRLMAARLEEELANGEVGASEQAYRRLGLLPDSIELEDLTIPLLGEQILGYYDHEADSLFVLADVAAEELEGVLVHEIVHALQDQHVPLDSIAARSFPNDRRMAARAAIEGHATLVMLLFLLEELTGRPAAVEDLPDLARLPLERFMPGRPLPVLAAAPRVVREGMVFPYARGAGFVLEAWRDAGSAPAFADVVPRSTEQVMDPRGRFLDVSDPPTEVRFVDDAAEPSGRWRTTYENDLGQFELSILLMERHSLQSEGLAGGWDGDRYRLLEDGEAHALVWYLVWDDARSAARFATAYRQILKTRLGRSASVEELTVDDRPVVRVVETAEGVDLETVPRLPVRLAPED